MMDLATQEETMQMVLELWMASLSLYGRKEQILVTWWPWLTMAQRWVLTKIKNKVENTTKVNINNKNVSPPISCNYNIDYTVVIQNGKMAVKYIGAHTKRLRNMWVLKMAYTNL